MNLQEMRECKRALGYSNETLAELSGVPLATVQKVLSGITKSPRQKTVEALSKVLGTALSDRAQTAAEQPAGQRMGYVYPEVFTEIRNVVREDDRPNTIEDIYALPDGTRAELIDGKLYYIPTPTRTHQKITGEMYLAAAAHIKAYHKECEVYIAPFGVYLNGDDSLYVEPDLSIICDTSRLSERGCMGAPDWIIEVVSAPSRKTDYAVKLNKYRQSGVREYWIVDPSLRTVLTYVFDDDRNVEDADLYPFEAEIESALFEGLLIRPADLF